MDSHAGQDVIRIPVRLVDGHWEFFYGGKVPVKDRAVGELAVSRGAISDPAFLAGLVAPTEHRLLDENAELLIALSVRSEEGDFQGLRRFLESTPAVELAQEFFASTRSAFNRFVRVTVGPQMPPAKDGSPGGVVLCLEGLRPKRIKVSSVVLPFSLPSAASGGQGLQTFASLNHALTALSEVFEPWRISHTGSIYTRVLFKGGDDVWYPLDRLRRVAEAKEEDALINRRWQQLMKSMLSSIGDR